jgi:ComF family protein
MKSSILNSIVSVILPPRCALTGEIVDRPGMISATAWASLTFIAPPCCHSCGAPFDVDHDAVDIDDIAYMQCGACLAHPPAFDQARSAIVYDEGSRDLLLTFKHGDQTHLTATFTPWLQTILSQQQWNADMIIPVPLHWTRLFKRRYNQSALLAKSLSDMTNIPVMMSILKRKRATQSQGHLSAKEREDNVKGAFFIPDQYNDIIKDKKIILIDDVFTTGATINECAKTLKKQGASDVLVLTIARAVRDGMAA